MNETQKRTDLVVTLHITICIFLTFANLCLPRHCEINKLCQMHIMFSVKETVKCSSCNMNRMSLNNCLDCEKTLSAFREVKYKWTT